MFPYDSGQVSQEPFPRAGLPVPQETVQGPMAGFEQAYQQTMMGAAPQGIRVESQAEAWAKGAAFGFGAALAWRAMKRRRQAKGEYTHPFFRFLAIWWTFMLAGFGLCLARPMETGWFLGIAFVLGTTLSLAYLVYRATGHGNYNSRRSGSPWRSGANRS